MKSNFAGSCEVPHKMQDSIGSAILTFIGYKQTDRQAKDIDTRLLGPLPTVNMFPLKTLKKKFRGFYKKNL